MKSDMVVQCNYFWKKLIQNFIMKAMFRENLNYKYLKLELIIDGKLN